MSLEVRLIGYILNRENFIFTNEYVEKALHGLISIKGLNEKGQLLLAEQMAYIILNSSYDSNKIKLYTYNMVQYFSTVHYLKIGDLNNLVHALLRSSLGHVIRHIPEWTKLEKELKSNMAKSDFISKIIAAADHIE